ncbi:MAG: hypothetical protein JXB49_31690, partial [Bacteroidales bacterium]|nr:hypothetical protein [Bacteroidales bacterium]
TVVSFDYLDLVIDNSALHILVFDNRRYVIFPLPQQISLNPGAKIINKISYRQTVNEDSPGGEKTSRQFLFSSEVAHDKQDTGNKKRQTDY